MNIYQRMEAVTAELQTVAKNLQVKAGAGTYKAVSERDIIDAVKPAEVKFGVYSYPADREIVEAERLESESSYNGAITKKTTFFMRLKTTYRFVNVEQPDEFVEMIVFADGMDSGDKACGKSMTYADKYALMKAYKISTGDDPDMEASVDTRYTATTTTRTRKAATKEKANVESEPQANAPIICEDCGQEIHSVGKYTAQAIADRSMNSFGKHLCFTCAMKNIPAKDAPTKEGEE